MGRNEFFRCQVEHAGDVGKCANEKSAKDFSRCVHDAGSKRDKCEKASKSEKSDKSSKSDKSGKDKK